MRRDLMPLFNPFLFSVLFMLITYTFFLYYFIFMNCFIAVRLTCQIFKLDIKCIEIIEKLAVFTANQNTVLYLY